MEKSISKLIEALQNNGNAKVYLVTPQVGIEEKYDFYINKNGELVINDQVASFNGLCSALAFIIYASIYQKTTVRSFLKDDASRNNEVINQLCSLTMRMISTLSNKDIANLILGGEPAFVSVLLSKLNLDDQNSGQEISIVDIEKQMGNLENTLFATYFIWKEVQSAKSVNEYKAARARWDALCSDEAPTEEKLPK